MDFDPNRIRDFPSHVREMEEAGYEVIVDGDHRPVGEGELIASLSGCDALVVTGEKVGRAVFEAVPSLKVVSRLGAGCDSVDVQAATGHGIAVTVTPGANAEAVAEYAFALMLALARGVVSTDGRVRRGQWGVCFGTSLYGKTLGVVGMGRIGGRLVQLTRGFAMRVLAYDFRRAADLAGEAEYVPLDDLLARSDFVSLHLPLTERTAGMLGARELALLKPTAMLVNCSRGGIVDEEALRAALGNRSFAGAALDVFAREPLAADDPLLGLDNVILSSHTAGMTHECRGLVVETAFRNVDDVFRGVVPAGLVNPEAMRA